MRTRAQILEELEVALFTMSDQRAAEPWFVDGTRHLSFKDIVDEVKADSAFGKYIVSLYQW